jgi:hypothetical protein
MHTVQLFFDAEVGQSDASSTSQMLLEVAQTECIWPVSFVREDAPTGASNNCSSLFSAALISDEVSEH